MTLREIDDAGHVRDVTRLSHLHDFNQVYLTIPESERDAIEAEINRRLDDLILSPDPNWGSITNTSIEGGQLNPLTGVRGDWTGMVFDPIHYACGENEELAGRVAVEGYYTDFFAHLKPQIVRYVPEHRFVQDWVFVREKWEMRIEPLASEIVVVAGNSLWIEKSTNGGWQILWHLTRVENPPADLKP